MFLYGFPSKNLRKNVTQGLKNFGKVVSQDKLERKI